MSNKTNGGKLVRVSYKLWVIVEEVKTYENNETYKELKSVDGGETYALGEFDTLDEAINQMRELGNN